MKPIKKRINIAKIDNEPVICPGKTAKSKNNPYLHGVAANPLVSKRKDLYTAAFSTF